MYRLMTVAAIAAISFSGCEDGPERVYESDEVEDEDRNGGETVRPFIQEGVKDFEFTGGAGDSVERAQFCDESTMEKMITEMVVQPIIPDVSVGGVPMWREDGTPIHADDVVGLPEGVNPADFTSDELVAQIMEAATFCDPDVYSNALAWGPTNEIIMFIDEETRLIDYFAVTQDYKGTMKGHFTRTDEEGNSQQVPVVFTMRERIMVGDKELDEYSSTAQQAERDKSWLNYQNINDMYRMVRETFFGDDPAKLDYDCVEEKICEVLYSADENQDVKQDTRVIFQDSGLQIPMSPEGHILAILVLPVKEARFEIKADFSFAHPDDENRVAPTFTSITRPSCNLDMTAAITWAQFREDCIGDDPRTLSRADYTVAGVRDSVIVEFNNVTFGFRHTSPDQPYFLDGSRPADDDVLYYATTTQSINGTLQEYRPLTLARAFKEKLEARLRDSVTLLPGEPANHPFLTYSLRIPPTFNDDPHRLGALEYDTAAGPSNWVADIIVEVNTLYDTMSQGQKDRVHKRARERVFVIEPYVDAVLDTLSLGHAAGPRAFKVFRAEDDYSWSFGYAHFVQGETPIRITGQYNLAYAALTAISVSVGYSAIDEIYDGWNGALRDPPPFQLPYPYYTLALAQLSPGVNSLALGGHGISVKPDSFSRQYGMLDVEVEAYSEGQNVRRQLTLPGSSPRDGNGYYRQIRGERYEYVPAWGVSLGGKETSMSFYVEEEANDDGSVGYTIGRVVDNHFKGTLEFCDGLEIVYGDDVREKLSTWVENRGFRAYEACEVVYNYSENGNVLDSIASLANRASITTYAGRAQGIAIWR